jgi:hypothetical protein
VRTVLVAILIGVACALFNVRLSIVDGESMAPSIRAGDSVVTIGLPTDQLRIGSILLVRDGERRLLHRLRAMSGEQLWMQGDASLSGDSRPVQRSDVLGQLALVIPTSHLFRAIRTAASFTASLPISVLLRSSGGVVVEQGARSVSGADTQGRLLPGGYALWSITLSACGVSGSRCAATYALRIDPVGFAALLPPAGSVGDASQALARALRIATKCQALAGGAWSEMSDRLTAEWSGSDQASGLLAEQSAAAARSGLRCEVKVTLLGVPAATGGSLALPLLWGPT